MAQQYSRAQMEAMMAKNRAVNDVLDSVQTQAENAAATRHDLRHPTTGRFVAASKPKRGMETGFGIKGARPTQ